MHIDHVHIHHGYSSIRIKPGNPPPPVGVPGALDPPATMIVPGLPCRTKSDSVLPPHRWGDCTRAPGRNDGYPVVPGPCTERRAVRYQRYTSRVVARDSEPAKRRNASFAPIREGAAVSLAFQCSSVETRPRTHRVPCGPARQRVTGTPALPSTRTQCSRERLTMYPRQRMPRNERGCVGFRLRSETSAEAHSVVLCHG